MPACHLSRYLWIIAFILICGCTDEAANAGTCPGLEASRNREVDAAPILADCIAKTPVGAALQLSPGTYQLLTSLTIDRAVTIETKPLASGRACAKTIEANCAILSIGELAPSKAGRVMPIEITAPDVQLRSLIITGKTGRSDIWEKRICLDERSRPLGGGVRVKGRNFHMSDVLLKNMSCYTAMEAVAGADGLNIQNNMVGPNGQHDVPMMWADGITVHDAANAIVQKNIFLDNSDVQLIFGGCRNCTVRANIFRHSPLFKHASFAELMLHAWPHSSGDFSGSVTSGNDIDCNASRRCGYGIMIGGEPWYPAKTFGGSVSDNRISNARMGINVDRITGEMIVRNNAVIRSGGAAISDCGRRFWPAVNISPRSRGFLKTDIVEKSSIETRGCLLNRQE